MVFLKNKHKSHGIHTNYFENNYAHSVPRNCNSSFWLRIIIVRRWTESHTSKKNYEVVESTWSQFLLHTEFHENRWDIVPFFWPFVVMNFFFCFVVCVTWVNKTNEIHLNATWKNWTLWLCNACFDSFFFLSHFNFSFWRIKLTNGYGAVKCTF